MFKFMRTARNDQPTAADILVKLVEELEARLDEKIREINWLRTQLNALAERRGIGGPPPTIH